MGRLLKIAAREYLAYVRTPGFWISMALIPFVIVLAAAGPILSARSTPAPVLAVIDLTGQGYEQAIREAAAHPQPGPRGMTRAPAARIIPSPVQARDAAEAGRLLRPHLTARDGSERLDAAAVIHGTGEAVAVDLWTRNPTDRSLDGLVHEAVGGRMRADALARAGLPPDRVEAIDRLEPKVADYSPRAAGGRVGARERLPGLVGFGLGMLLWMMVLSSSSVLLNSVVEEKSSRIMEILLASASPRELMGGKILGVAGVIATTLGLWLAVAIAILSATSPQTLADLGAVMAAHGMIAYFAVYLVGGYLMYAALFTAVGAWCETVREAQTLLAPIMMLLTVPVLFLGQAIVRPDTPALQALSWVPLFTPFLMPARAAADPPAWQILGTALLVAASAAASLWLSARAFRAGALSSGKVTRAAFFGRFFGG